MREGWVEFGCVISMCGEGVGRSLGVSDVCGGKGGEVFWCLTMI